MMILTKKLSSKQVDAMTYFANRLLSPQMQRNVGVRVVIRRTMPVLGITIIDDYNESGLPRRFTIEMDGKQDSEEKLRTLAHEMVHIKQYCKKELNEEMTKWKGQSVDSDSMDYDDQPWEIEAHTLGDKLYEEFKCQQQW
jgi:hypothetical protein